ncbi:16S rRNA (cytosine(1402)-N(4))-methyltransferase RsmH [Pseudahrensia aquimaris]|uniref:Ribosomal RNA small subunit methyltransferase H n=1 Tax=Pseudahrensia aquimaris TaxID=744461 RepID=A0ABW3FCR8_9HYPH
MNSMSDVNSPHIPVMLDEVLHALAPEAGQTIIDATFGAGGYTRAMLIEGLDVLAIDRDPNAIAAGQSMVQAFGERLMLEQGRFSALDAIAKGQGFESVDGVVADIGVSSMQIDQAERGFSFQKDGPLDMRMEQAGVSAADVVNFAARSDLTRIIGILGDERQASRISAEIVEQREKKPFETTLVLASLVEKVLGRKHDQRTHPATRTFQALRIFVNRELDELADALLAAERILKPGGRLVVVTFHSLEDRLVKRFLQDRAENSGGSRHLPMGPEKDLTFKQHKRGAVLASKAEAERNPRARSAKLRWAIRTDVAPKAADRSVFGLPNLADLESVKGWSK